MEDGKDGKKHKTSFLLWWRLKVRKYFYKTCHDYFSSITEIYLAKKNCIYLRCILRNDYHNLSPHKATLAHGCMVRTLEIYSLCKFQVYTTLLLRRVTKPDIRSPEHTHLITESLYPLQHVRTVGSSSSYTSGMLLSSLQVLFPSTIPSFYQIGALTIPTLQIEKLGSTMF